MAWFAKNLNSVALHSSTTKLQLPLRSLDEKWKVAKASLYMILWDSVDPLIRSLSPDEPTGKKWALRKRSGPEGNPFRLFGNPSWFFLFSIFLTQLAVGGTKVSRLEKWDQIFKGS
ncbi:hypothetical protein ACROYT_G044745 [Oculina patagonica]